ncbi:hypothetical protein [Rhodococcus triatomae]|nr:hypothetical protein G419_13526 [Rhodococcus triatomae BKS 15-14]
MTITDDAPRARTSRDPETRARLARIFGDVLPDTTGDERAPEDGRDSSSDEWLRRQVPPHHG